MTMRLCLSTDPTGGWIYRTDRVTEMTIENATTGDMLLVAFLKSWVLVGGERVRK